MNKDLNLKLIIRVLGGLTMIQTFFLLLPTIVAIVYKEYNIIHYYLIAAGISFVLGLGGYLYGRDVKPEMGRREGAIIVTLVWLFYTLLGTLPFWMSGSIPRFTDAFFETLSGFTTTGTTILDNIESLPYNILFWRSMTHWIGGLGIVVIFLAILPVLGGGGFQLFSSETTTPTKEKFMPKISQTAVIMFSVYISLTVLIVISLRVAGMNWFDAVNHGLSIISTGGFSTKQASIAFWNSSVIEYVIIVFMFLSGVNFILFYLLVTGRFDKILKNDELKYYVGALCISTLIILLSHIDFNSGLTWTSFEQSFRSSLFITTSCITSAGLSTEDYTLWSPYTWIVLLILMISGASSYSTSGGIKMVRVAIILKMCYNEFKRLVHPNAVIIVRYEGKAMKDDAIIRVVAFVMIYLLIIVVGSFILGISGLGFEESLSGMITCMSDVGLGLGQLGPSHSFSDIPTFSKWFLAFIMLVGRLELYSVLLLFTPHFWKE
ncbi:MAG: TrkH family potassium uptake protein [Paludibacteraceae bacterium]